MKRLLRAAVPFAALSVVMALLAPAGHAERAPAGGSIRPTNAAGGTPAGGPGTGAGLAASELDRAGEVPGGEPEEGEDILGREEWFYGQRAFPRDAVPKGAYLKARKQAGKLPRFPFTANPTGAGRARRVGGSFAWTSIGPRPIHSAAPLDDAGRVTSLAVQTDQIVYAGSAGGGAWKTTNGGLSWTPLFDKQPSLAIGSITIDPNSSNNVWVGTGEGNFSADSYYGAGLFRSTNAGATWFKVGGTTFDGCSISDVVVKPGASTTIGVAVQGSGVAGPTACPATQQGVWVSTNNGSTWTLKAPPPGGLFSPTGATDLAISPADPAKWFAGMANGAVWRSTDSGQTWGPVLIDPNGGRVSLAISPSNPKTMVAAVEILPTTTAPGTADLYLSNDEGTNWNNTQLPVPPGLCGPPPGQCWYDLVLTFDPSTNRAFFIGGLPLFREEFAGGSWTATSVGSSIHADVHALSFDPTGDMWVGHDGGVTTLRWSPLSQIIVGRSEDLPIAEFEPGISGDLSQLIGGTQDNGTLRFTGSQQWERILGGDGGFSASDPTDANTIYASNFLFTSNRTVDGGATWTLISPALTSSSDLVLFYSPLTNEPGAPDTVYTGSRQLWRSTDQGATWSAQSPLFGTFAARTAISAIAPGTTTSSATNTSVYAGLSSGGAEFSSDITASTPTWSASVGLPVRYVTDFRVDPANPKDAYAAVSGFGTAHLYHTTDGVNWTPSSGNHPDTPVNAVAVDDSGAFPIIYTGTDVGVFASGDGGQTWQNASTNLPPTVVMDLLIDPGKGTLIAATHGRGAYTAQLDQAPPFARLTAPAGITRPVTARFNVPVQNVTTSDFVLRVQGTTTNLPGSVACADAGGAPVDCLTGPVTTTELQPTAPLIPGQRYTASVDPAGAPDQVVDGFGTPVLTTSLAFRTSLREEETSAAAAYTWQTVTPGTTPGPLGGSYDQHHLLRATASFGFDGPQITWITVNGPDQGLARVFVDNALVGTFDDFSPTATYNVRHTFSGLSTGHHVIRIEPAGVANPSGTDSFVSVDGFQVGDTAPIPTPRVTYGWQPDSAFDSRIGYVRSDLGPTSIARETTATFTFRGTAVTWRTIAGPDQGRAQVLIDGVNKGVVDNYRTTLAQRAVTFGGLADTVHTMKIVVLGTNAPASTGTYVGVDGWKIH